jgi:D-serine deaminase-like pyridoxal phosphate-dependent protein
VGIEAGKLPRAAALVRNGARLTLILDSVEATRSVAEFAAQERVKFHVLIEIDTGEGRSGVMPEAAELLEIARVVHAPPFAVLDGTLTHAGHS